MQPQPNGYHQPPGGLVTAWGAPQQQQYVPQYAQQPQYMAQPQYGVPPQYGQPPQYMGQPQYMAQPGYGYQQPQMPGDWSAGRSP